MSDRLATWPIQWRDDTIPYSGGCHICGSCAEPGWVQVEAIATGFCRCCIEILVAAAPHLARAVLAKITTPPLGGETT